ncbi:MAG: D-glycerate dehydrogenase [Bacillota bacterium]|nr:D-glycerate dehydrogenase [Bacillota bacterium]
MRPKVVITRKMPEEGLRLLDGKYTINLNEKDRPVTRNELKELLFDASALLCMLNDTVDEAILKGAPKLKIVSNLAVGTNNVDLKACTRMGIVVTNTPGVLTEATADLTFALLLAVTRRIVEGDRFIRDGKFDGWDPLLFVGGDLYGKTLGIIGMGRIGQAVARRARGFGMKIVYNNRKPVSEETARLLEASYAPLEEVIRQADFLTLHLPYYPEVHHLINGERLKIMKPGAYLINTARGAHLDEKSLVEHLKEKRIAGAALDVFENEPELAPSLTGLDNVVLVPHLGSASAHTRKKMAVMAAESICDLLDGRKPERVVNREVYEQE